jgi:hypothetical protein
VRGARLPVLPSGRLVAYSEGAGVIGSQDPDSIACDQNRLLSCLSGPLKQSICPVDQVVPGEHDVGVVGSQDSQLVVEQLPEVTGGLWAGWSRPTANRLACCELAHTAPAAVYPSAAY